MVPDASVTAPQRRNCSFANGAAEKNSPPPLAPSRNFIAVIAFRFRKPMQDRRTQETISQDRNGIALP